MKKLMAVLMAVIFLTACNNEAKKSFEQLSVEINQKKIDDLRLSSLEELSNKIDYHLNHYPDYEKNLVLIDTKKQISIVVDNLIYNQLINRINQAENIAYPDYESAIKSYTVFKDKLSQYVNNATSEQNIQDAENRIEEISEQLNNINSEQSDFYNVINSDSVNDIEEFLNKYPHSVMRNALYEKTDEIYYSEFLSDFSSSPSSIYRLNAYVKKAKAYLSKFRSIEAKTKINELISEAETQRRSILELELQDKLQDLMERMEGAAKNRAESTHPTYVVEMCAARGSNPEIIGYSSTFERLYQVNMKGAFLGLDKREMMIAVSGRIKGDLQNGASISITGTRVDTDDKH